MATQVPDPSAPKPFADDPYVPGDPIPAAEAVEADSESVWALFSDTPKKPDDEEDFPETQRAPL